MAQSKPATSTEGTYDKARSHDQLTVAWEIVHQDTVQHLIAFASTIPIQSGKKWSVENPEYNRGVSRILDSIANISISQAQGEVVAVALQQTNTDIKLIVASNNTLPASTIIYLKSVWDILKRLCQDYQDYNVVPDHTKYPKRPSTKSTKPRLCPMILRFNNQKLRRQISKYFMDFVSINRLPKSVD